VRRVCRTFIPFFLTKNGFSERILSAAAGIDRSLRETKGEDFVNRLHASLPTAGSAPTTLSDAPTILPGKSDEETMHIYESWANKVRFEYCDLSIPPPAPKEGDMEGSASTPSYKFHFNNDARMLANADIPKRSLAIAKEVRRCFYLGLQRLVLMFGW
jgi:hypothetical protein